MGVIDKAIWYIESHFESAITLDDIADVAGVSRFHLTRAFGYATGYSAMQYVRLRRMANAAERLAHGEADILGLALRLGYGSHEAFTRAFRDQFACTPQEVRTHRSVSNLHLLEAIELNGNRAGHLAKPKIVDGKPLLIAGISRSYSHGTSSGIPAQWQQFNPHLGHVPGQINNCAYGVLYNDDDEGNYDYLCGVEVADFSALAAAMTRIRIPEHRYAVFFHADHVAMIRGTWSAIWSDGLPDTGHEAADAPTFERYRATFDSKTGMGGVEIWVPVIERA